MSAQVKITVPVSYQDECNMNDQVVEKRRLSSRTTQFEVAVLITVHDAVDYVRRCIRSIWNSTEDHLYTLYLINDESSEATLAELKYLTASRKKVVLVNWDSSKGDLHGYTRAINLGLRIARKKNYDAYCLLNSDTEVQKDWLSALVTAAFSSPEIGIVGPLSNAASYQSVPKLRDTNNGTTDWSKNPLPAVPKSSTTLAGHVIFFSENQKIRKPENQKKNYIFFLKNDSFLRPPRQRCL